MGAVVGKPDAQTIKKALKGFKDVGITQYLIYPRSGCELEYMSDEWLDTCEKICATAKELGYTSIWLYDEFNWPSGTANKTVMKQNPDFVFRHLNAVKNKDGNFEIVMRENPDMSNLLEPDAVECFISLTHEKYAKKLAPYLGSFVKGVFTDEPSAGYFNWKQYASDKIKVPYYKGIEEDYKKLTGTDLRTDMLIAARTGSLTHEEPVNRLIAKRFSQTYAKRISDWCAKHGMVLTGHLMDEYFSSKALRQNGHPLKVLSEFSFPAIDDIFMANLRDGNVRNRKARKQRRVDRAVCDRPNGYALPKAAQANMACCGIRNEPLLFSRPDRRARKRHKKILLHCIHPCPAVV